MPELTAADVVGCRCRSGPTGVWSSGSNLVTELHGHRDDAWSASGSVVCGGSCAAAAGADLDAFAVAAEAVAVADTPPR